MCQPLCHSCYEKGLDYERTSNEKWRNQKQNKAKQKPGIAKCENKNKTKQSKNKNEKTKTKQRKNKETKITKKKQPNKQTVIKQNKTQKQIN